MAITREQALAKKDEVLNFDSLREFELNKFLLQNYRGLPLAVPEAMLGEGLTEIMWTLKPYDEAGWKFMRFSDERGKFVIFK